MSRKEAEAALARIEQEWRDAQGDHRALRDAILRELMRERCACCGALKGGTK